MYTNVFKGKFQTIFRKFIFVRVVNYEQAENEHSSVPFLLEKNKQTHYASFFSITNACFIECIYNTYKKIVKSTTSKKKKNRKQNTN